MRQSQPIQFQLGEVDIARIQFDPQSRDDIPQLLRGIQNLYKNGSVKTDIFKLLETIIPDDINKENGRPGMTLSNILVLGMLRLNINCDYDRVHELANNHTTLRQMLGHGLRDENSYYSLQCIKDNIRLLTPEVMDKINQIVVKHAHKEFDRTGILLKGRCDSFVLETDVHYPTDINLLADAMRVIIRTSSRLSEIHCLTEWNQHVYHQRIIRKLYRKAQNMKSSTSKNIEKQEKQEEAIKQAHSDYIDQAVVMIDKAKFTLTCIELLTKELDDYSVELIEELKKFTVHAQRQIDQIQRRVIKDEVIPHDEKVFSLFEEHTEWIVKGKAGVPVELGLRVNIIEDQFGYILHHQVIEKETDDQIAVSAVKETQARYPNFKVCSFDKGYHSPSNQKELTELLDLVVLPKKGKLGKADKEREQSEEFKNSRKKHSAVESGINALEVHGLDRCYDHGIERFKLYTSIAVLARNVQKLGSELQKREREEAKNKERRRKNKIKLAA